MNIRHILGWVPQGIRHNLRTQPWNLALIICLLSGQVFLRTFDHRYLWLAPALALIVTYLALRRQVSFHSQAQLTRALFVLALCISFTLRWVGELKPQAEVYQIYQRLNHGIRPITVTGFVDEDFTFRINRPLVEDPDAWVTLPFRLSSGERLELGMKQSDYDRLGGQRALEVSGKLETLKQAANPGGFDAHILGAGRGIYLRLNVTNVRSLELAQRISWQERARSLRTQLYEFLRERQGGEFAGYYLALWTGDRRYVSKRLMDASNSLGLSYRLSPTGQQLGLWYMALPQLLRGYERKKRHRLKVVFLFILTLLTGGSISLIKGLLFQALLAYQMIQRLNRSRAQTMGLVATMLLVYRPSLAVHPGYLLSIAVSFLFYWPEWTKQQMEDFELHVNNRLSSQRQSPLCSKTTQLLSLSIFLPTILRLVGLSPNRLTMFTMFLAPGLQVLGFPIILLSSIVPGLGQRLMDQLVNLGIVSRQGSFLLLYIDSLRLFLLGIIASYNVLLRYYTWMRMSFDRRRLRQISTTVSFIILLIVRLITWPPWQEIRVTFFSVGSADMILCETRTASYLIDTGEHDGHAKTLVDAMHLWRKPGLDVVFVSHEDKDHSGGLISVLEHIPAGMVLTPKKRVLSIEEFESLRQEVTQVHRWDHDGWCFTLYPAKSEHLSENDRSLVLHLEGLQSILFGADIEENRERELIGFLNEVDVLKVPHHGSRSSSTEVFLNKLKPKIAVISVGPRHGHPHAEVVERYEERKIELYRTDEDGAVIYTLQRGEAYVKTTYTRRTEYGLLSSLISLP